jgi:hypothetical protein
MGAHDAAVRDPGNTDPEHLTTDLDDDELADVLALLAEIRDNQQDLRDQQRGVL